MPTGQSAAPNRTRQLIWFLARTGVRVALREQVPALVLALGFSILLGQGFPRHGFLVSLSFVLFPSASRPGFSVLLLALLLLWVASIAGRRVRSGLSGALLSLPATAGEWRRAVWLGTAVATVPVCAAIALLLALAVARPIDPLPAGRAIESALTLLIVALSSAALVASRPRRSQRDTGVAGTAWALATIGAWLSLAAALVALLLWDRQGSRLDGSPLAGCHPQSWRGRATRGRSAGPILALISLRALGPRLLLPWLAGALALGAGALFLHNNDLSDPHAAGAERLASMCALGLAAALLVGQLAARRSRWPWARSLPWSARRRVLIEATHIAIALVPVVVVCVLATPGGALSALAALPFVALRATSQQLLPSRLPPGLRTGLETLPAAALCALVPFISLILLGLAPGWLRLAVAAERDWAASAWQELEHSAEGDPLLSTVP